MTELTSWDDVPAFQTEDEERAFWDTHCLSEVLLQAMAGGPSDPRLSPPLRVSRRDFEHVARSLMHPEPPNEKLRAGYARWRELSEGSHD